MDERQQLLARKSQLEQLIRNKQEIIMIPLSEWTDELSSYDQHPADSASDLYEREKNLGILELLELELEKVNDSLNRFDSGQGAICSICGQPIEPQRLNRLVGTTVCARCAHYYDQAYKINNEVPAEPGLMSDRGEGFQVAGYELFEE